MCGGAAAQAPRGGASVCATRRSLALLTLIERPEDSALLQLIAHLLQLIAAYSIPAVWLEECRFFYEHLRNRGYPAKAINACFREINWNQRQKMLEPKKRKDVQDTFFTKYRGCVFSSRNAPGINALRQELNLSLDDLRRDSAGHDIFPQRAYFAVKSAMSMASILRR